jgi:hypothetical protein
MLRNRLPVPAPVPAPLRKAPPASVAARQDEPTDAFPAVAPPAAYARSREAAAVHVVRRSAPSIAPIESCDDEIMTRLAAPSIMGAAPIQPLDGFDDQATRGPRRSQRVAPEPAYRPVRLSGEDTATPTPRHHFASDYASTRGFPTSERERAIYGETRSTTSGSVAAALSRPVTQARVTHAPTTAPRKSGSVATSRHRFDASPSAPAPVATRSWKGNQSQGQSFPRSAPVASFAATERAMHTDSSSASLNNPWTFPTGSSRSVSTVAPANPISAKLIGVSMLLLASVAVLIASAVAAHSGSSAATASTESAQIAHHVAPQAAAAAPPPVCTPVAALAPTAIATAAPSVAPTAVAPSSVTVPAIVAAAGAAPAIVAPPIVAPAVAAPVVPSAVPSDVAHTAPTAPKAYVAPRPAQRAPAPARRNDASVDQILADGLGG